MKVPYVHLNRYLDGEREEIEAAFDALLERGDYVGGGAIAAFERDIATFCGVDYSVALNSGTDALILAMKALGIGPGDEVITPPNSFIASTASIVMVGARPVFADVGDDQNLAPERAEESITPATKAIMPVHLTGRIAAMDELKDIADRHALHLVEDAAQAVGSEYRGKRSGDLGTVGCFSAHPLKNLNAIGDAGFVTTNDRGVYEKILCLRNHGLADRNTVREFGTVSRMDTLQAEILRIRLGYLPKVIELRRRNASIYRDLLDQDHVFIPACRDYEFNTFHTFVIQVERRDALRAWLADHGVATAVHYPVPIHLQPAARHLGYTAGDFPMAERQSAAILTLPINQFMTEDEVAYVAEAINGFYC